jgi:uncharacterized membrane protein
MVKAAHWEAICRRIEQALRHGQFQEGVVEGIQAVSRLLVEHFPRRADDRNELPDRPVAL